jgi:hypothetical protein
MTAPDSRPCRARTLDDFEYQIGRDGDERMKLSEMTGTGWSASRESIDVVNADIRRWKRRCFWAGFRSIWDLSGRQTMREMRTLERERLELVRRMLRADRPTEGFR